MIRDKHKEGLKYLINKDKYITRAKTQRVVIRQYIRDMKTLNPCTDCGIRYPYYVMDFDHLGDKSFNIADMSNWSSIARVRKEIAKCEPVCANCHRERTAKRRLAKYGKV